MHGNVSTFNCNKKWKNEFQTGKEYLLNIGLNAKLERRNFP